MFCLSVTILSGKCCDNGTVINILKVFLCEAKCRHHSHNVACQNAVKRSCDERPLDYHSDRQALSTRRFRRAGPSATAVTTCCCQPANLLSRLVGTTPNDVNSGAKFFARKVLQYTGNIS